MGKTYYIRLKPPAVDCCPKAHPHIHYNTHWEPIITALNDILQLKCGLSPSDDSNFRIYEHSNRNKRPEGALFCMQMHLSHLYSVDTMGWGVTHSQMFDPSWRDTSLVEAKDSLEVVRQGWLSDGISKMGQPPMGDIPHKDYILLTLQMPFDSVIKDYSPLPMVQMMCWLESWARDNKTLVVVKPHPGSVGQYLHFWSVLRGLTQRSGYFVMSEANIHSLTQNCRAVMTVNSGTGFEGLIHGKPVITFGRCDYEALTFRGKPFDMPVDKIERFIAEHPFADDQTKFAHHYIFKRNYWLGKSDDADARLMEYVSKCAEGFYQNYP